MTKMIQITEPELVQIQSALYLANREDYHTLANKLTMRMYGRKGKNHATNR